MPRRAARSPFAARRIRFVDTHEIPADASGDARDGMALLADRVAERTPKPPSGDPKLPIWYNWVLTRTEEDA